MRSRRSSGRTTIRVACAVAAASLGASPLLLLSRATADASFDAVAGANAVDVVAADPQDIPLIGSVEAGGTWGQASLDSNGHSSGFAAFPNPGRGTAEAPALLGAPADPFFLSVDNGQEPQDVSQPGMHLHAEATDTSATGYAVAGQEGAASSRSAATVRQSADGTVAAVATATADVVAVGPVTVGGVDATASATRDPSGRLATVAHTAIARIEVAGQEFGFRDGTFTAAGQSTPLPASTVLGPLSAAGVTAAYQQPVKSDSGIVSGNLVLRYTVPATPQTAPVQLTLKLGEADASIGYAPLGGSSSTGPSGGVGTPAQPGGSTGAASTGGSLRAAGALSAPSGGTTQPPSVAANPSTPGSAVGLAALRKPIDSTWLYLAVVIAALAAFGAAQAVRLLGVKFLWTS